MSSREGMTQGDPTVMATYAHGLVPHEQTSNIEVENRTKMVAFADDLTGAGSLKQLQKWCNKLLNVGPK